MFFIQKLFIYRYIFAVIFFQIILESFPISSSGHLKLLTILNEKYLFFFPESLQEVGINIELLHLPTIFIIFLFFWLDIKQVFNFLFNSFNNFVKVVLFFCFTTFIPACFYLIKLSKFNFYIPLYINFVITGLVIFYSYYCKEKKIDSWSLKNGIALGVMQGLALLPGISRFAIVFVTARFLGYKNKESFFLTFLIELPLLVAGVLKGFYEIYTLGKFGNLNLNILVSIFVASVISYVCLIFMQKIIDKNKFWVLSFYMLIPAVVSYLLGV